MPAAPPCADRHTRRRTRRHTRRRTRRSCRRGDGLAPYVTISTFALGAFGVLCGGCGSGSSQTKTIAGPSPSASAITRGSTVSAYLSTFQGIQSTDSFTFSLTESSNYTPDLNHFSSSPASATFTTTGSQGGIYNLTTDLYPFLLFAVQGSTTQETITLPKSGPVSVTREDLMVPLSENGSGGGTEHYLYYTVSADGTTETVYGSDGYYGGVLSGSVRWDPGIVIPLNLPFGGSFSQTYTEYDMDYDILGGVDNPLPIFEGAFNYDVTLTLNFTLLPSLTVSGGTYSNVAALQFSKSCTLPIGKQGSTTINPVTQTEIYDVSQYVGLVQAQSTLVTQNEMLYAPGGTPIYTAVETDNSSYELVKATVGGVNYPPGRSAQRK